MKSNAKCWKRPAVDLVIGMSCLSACATVSSDSAIGGCPPIVNYSRAEQIVAADEIEALHEDAILIVWLADYSVLREQLQSCALQ